MPRISGFLSRGLGRSPTKESVFMGRHSRPSKAASFVAGTAPAAVAGVIVFAAPAAHAQADPPQAPVVTVSDIFHRPTLQRSLERAVTVHPDDTLSGISERECGTAADWTGIAAGNRPTVKDPDLIFPGEKLVVDCRTAAIRLPVVHDRQAVAAIVP